MRFLLSVLLLVTSTSFLVAENPPIVGYIDCSMGDRHRATPIFSNVCVSQPVETLNCGQQVNVLSREGPWFKIHSADGKSEYFVSVTSVSARKNRFVALDLPPGASTPDCSAFRTQTGKVLPQAIYAPDPGYTDKARKAGVQGEVLLAVTVGTDGRTHDAKVLHSLGYGLDEKAVEAVRSWRWKPGLRDGKPIDAEIRVEVQFRLLK